MRALLAFDTATDAMAIAVVTPAGVLAEDVAGGPQASARLLPQAQALLARAGVALADLDAIAFGRGPGAFTGLRVACSVAQGLALGAGKPVLPIDSLAIVADDARAQTGTEHVAVAMDARMDEIYAAAYRWQGEAWHETAAPALLRPEALNAAWRADAPAVVAGSALDAFGDRLHTGTARTVPQPRSRAAALGRLAAMAWRDGRAVDAALALPLYVRDKVAQTTAEREALRAAAQALQKAAG